MTNRSYNFYSPESFVAKEAYVALAANIYPDLEKKRIYTLVVTGTEPRVGKTVTAENIAITLAALGKRTLLMDMDLRKPVEKNAGYQQGAVQYLQGNALMEEVLYPTNMENLNYLPKGRNTGNPAGLFCSRYLLELFEKARENYDCVVIDTPSLDCVPDAAILAMRADAAILVAKMNKTSIKSINQAKEKLQAGNVNLLGVILNQVSKNNYKNFFKSYGYFNKLNKKLPKPAANKNGLMTA
ncbi:tyrosine-protein kinase YwqD [Ruminiclostridium hungatei]|uniref:non-specific protein-tyrosine kinase n=1 Tax=Ruminiclostridium hungatei TaxID=48256 RepID=A0A1V4SNL5_RUMHU|nr:CpsD/CapB family tyrosine-protein kinase [Ruminiclostridium hungatei]OPX44827.1 tyrosine-protein kinase YwqD [Ruminiclostridium hungatei]